MAKSDCNNCGKCVLTESVKNKTDFYRVPEGKGGPLIFCSAECLWEGGLKAGRKQGLQQAKEFAEAMLVTA